MTAFWIILIVGIIALLEVAYYQKRALSRVTYTRSFSRPRAFAGEKVELVEVITNEKLAPVPWIRVESRVSAALRFKSGDRLGVAADSFHKSLFFLGSYSRITRRHEITCMRRGFYNCGLVSVSASDLFGLAGARRDLETGAKLIVYPAIPSRAELPEEALRWQGEMSVRRWIMPDPILVNGIRAYRPGDPRRDVHWAATAKTGELQVKLRDYTVSPRVMLLFNCQIRDALHGGMEPEDVAFLEGGVGICAALAAWCCSRGVELGFASNGENAETGADCPFLAPQGGEGRLDSVLEALAKLNIKMKIGFHALLDRLIAENMTGEDIVLVSAYRSESLEKRAETLRRMGNSVSWVSIRGDGEGRRSA